MGSLRVLLADDNKEDCNHFQEAINGFNPSITFSIVSNGEQLIEHLGKKKKLPHILFLDLNMPRKNGFDCLEEIKRDEKFKSLPVIIFSTSYNPDIVNMLYQKGAHYYIHKPTTYTELKKAINKVLALMLEMEFIRPSKEKFVISIPDRTPH